MSRVSSGIFVTGTDTNVGKTFVSSLILLALKSAKISAKYFKPIQTGDDDDTRRVFSLTQESTESPFPRPTYCFPEPLAPSRAARLAKEKIEIQIDNVVESWNGLKTWPVSCWVVEGAGGLLVPLNSRQTIRDLILALELRSVVVASTRLGTINHTLLTLEAAKKSGVNLCGIVLNGPEDPGLPEILEDFSGVPVLARVPPLSEGKVEQGIYPSEQLQFIASQIFHLDVLRKMYGQQLE